MEFLESKYKAADMCECGHPFGHHLLIKRRVEGVRIQKTGYFCDTCLCEKFKLKSEDKKL